MVGNTTIKTAHQVLTMSWILAASAWLYTQWQAKNKLASSPQKEHIWICHRVTSAHCPSHSSLQSMATYLPCSGIAALFCLPWQWSGAHLSYPGLSYRKHCAPVHALEEIVRKFPKWEVKIISFGIAVHSMCILVCLCCNLSSLSPPTSADRGYLWVFGVWHWHVHCCSTTGKPVYHACVILRLQCKGLWVGIRHFCASSLSCISGFSLSIVHCLVTNIFMTVQLKVIESLTQKCECALWV